MKVVYPRCAGIDIHKESMTVCVIVDRQDGSAPEYQKRKLATHQEGVRELISWLEECQGKTARNRGKRLEQGKTAQPELRDSSWEFQGQATQPPS